LSSPTAAALESSRLRDSNPDVREVEDLVGVAPDEPALSEKEGGEFAKPVADRVEQGRLHHRYQRLRFAVELKFIGMLREQLSEQTRQMIFEEINDDHSALDAREVEAHPGRR
jgi:protein required for attachment to host cells